MRRCIVILSGGQDSTICLAWAKKKFEEVHAITFDYGQRHSVEIEAANKVASLLHARSHEVISVGDVLKGTSPLLSGGQEPAHYAGPDQMPYGVEPTFVPARNLFFLAVAANRAVLHEAGAIVIGVCQADFGGYHDCRQPFINAAGHAISEALEGRRGAYTINTPLMDLTKADSVRLAATLPGCMEALAYSHTCYDGRYPPNPFNHSSMLRAKGFFEAGVPDPLIIRAKTEKLLPPDYPDSGYVPDTKYAKGVEVKDTGGTLATYAPDSVEPAESEK